MTRVFFRVLTITIFIFSALSIGALVLFPPPWNAKKHGAEAPPRIVVPRAINPVAGTMDNIAEYMAWEDSMTSKIPLSEGEVVVSVLNGFFDGGSSEKQFVAYRNLLEIESPIYITFIDYDETEREHKRIWSGQTAASRPGTVRLYTQDLLGDRSVCAILYGMNASGEHTLTVFRKNFLQITQSIIEKEPGEELFIKIAEIKIDGNITIRETERTAAYRNGLSRGQSFNISAFGRDFDSANILDQVEIVYAYNTASGLYEEGNKTRIPGAQVEQRRVREILGNAKAFEEFVSGLWYNITPRGTIDKDQYIFFSPSSREIIFYGDETQQVFNWQNSAATRYGLHITSQNISITTLRRSVDLELESLDSIRVRVIEDVRLNLGVSAPWDGSYRKAGPLENRAQKPKSENAHIDAWYEGPMGKMHFFSDGSYELNSGGVLRQGKYAFFYLGDQELVELRSNELRSGESNHQSNSALNREIYLIEKSEADLPNPKTLTMNKVRIGARGIVMLNERAVVLTLVSD